MVDFTQQDYKCAMNMQSIVFKKTRSTKQTIALKNSWRSFCNLFLFIFNPICVKQSKKDSTGEVLVTWLGMCYGRRFDRHNWFDDTINNIDCEVCAVRGGLIDGVNILPKIGNDDAYQKSREMIYTPYTMFTVSYILHRTFQHLGKESLFVKKSQPHYLSVSEFQILSVLVTQIFFL